MSLNPRTFPSAECLTNFQSGLWHVKCKARSYTDSLSLFLVCTSARLICQTSLRQGTELRCDPEQGSSASVLRYLGPDHSLSGWEGGYPVHPVGIDSTSTQAVTTQNISACYQMYPEWQNGKSTVQKSASGTICSERLCFSQCAADWCFSKIYFKWITKKKKWSCI